MPKNNSFSLPQDFLIKEYKSLTEALQYAKFDGDLTSSFQRHSTYDGAIELYTPIKEPEFGMYVDNVDALTKIPSFIAQNPSSTIGKIADRNYMYVTAALAHQNPDHTLNKDYIAQWRIEVEERNGELYVSDMRFCIKSRNKDLMRDEWELKVEDTDQTSAIQALQNKYGYKLPPVLREPAENIAAQLFVSGQSTTSRSGYNGFQYRKKWLANTLHQFSSDVQIVANANGIISKRHELEDEVKGILGSSLFLATNFTRIATGALDLHRGKIINTANKNRIKLSQSNLSKAVFAEHASQGSFDNSSTQHEGWKNRVMPMSTIRDQNLQVSGLLTQPEMVAGILNMIANLPKKGELFIAPEEYNAA